MSLYFYLEVDTEGRVGSAAHSLWPWCGSGSQLGASLPPPQFHAPLAAALRMCRMCVQCLWAGLPLNSHSLVLLGESVLFLFPLLCLQQGATCNLQVRVDSVAGEGAGQRQVQVTARSGAADLPCPSSLSSLTRFSVV